MKIRTKHLGLIIIATALTACGSKGSLPTDYSERTGFDYNNPEAGFFDVHSI